MVNFVNQRLITSLALSLMLICGPALAADGPGKSATTGAAPIKIGFITDLTGAGAPIGQEMLKGAELYLDRIHHKMAGRDVVLVVENDESSGAMAIEKTRKLIESDKVDLLDGLLLGNIGYAVAPVAEKFKIPTVIAICGSDDLTQRKRLPWVIRTSFSSSQSNHPFGEWVYKNLGYKRVVTFCLDYSFGWENAGGFQKSFEEAGGKVVQKIWAPLGFTDFRPFLKQIRPDADAVYIATAGAAAAILPAQYKETGLKLPVIAGGTSFDEVILRKVGDKALGAVSALTYCSTLDTPANVAFTKAYRAKYPGLTPSFYTEGGYTSVMWIQRAVDALHGDLQDKNKLLAALRKVEITDAPRGPVKLDEYGNPVENVYIQKVVMIDGKPHNKLITTFKSVSQFWKWNPLEYMSTPVYSRNYPPCKFCDTGK